MKKTLFVLSLALMGICGNVFAQEKVSFEDQHPEYLPTLQVGTMAPEIAACDTTSTEIKLSDYKGKYVVLDFWATWCGDCRREVPGLKALYSNEAYKKIADKEVKWFSFSFDGKREAWVKFLRKEQFPWTQVSNLLRTRQDPTFKAYELNWIPAFFIVDPEGKIAGKAITAEGLEAELKRIAAE